MNLNGIPLVAMIKGKMSYVTQRQKLIAENVANADSPGFTPRDLKPFTMAKPLNVMAPVSATRTQTAHMGIEKAPPSGWKPVDSPDSEVQLDGNQVTLEDEMMKMTSARLDYETAVGLYQKSLGLIRLASRRAG